MSVEKLPYLYESIVNGEKIYYGPMKIKHQKLLVELQESIKLKEIPDMNFFELLMRINEDLISKPLDELYYADFEYLIFLIRAKTYGESINYNKYSNDMTEIVNITFNILKDFEVIGNKGMSNQRIKLSNDETIEISPLYLKEVNTLSLISGEDSKSYTGLTYSLRKKILDDEVITFNSYEEKASYFNELTIDDLKEVKKKYNEFPKLNMIINKEIKGKTYITNFGDIISNFFESV